MFVNSPAAPEPITETLIIDGNTSFDDSCDMSFFGNYEDGQTPLKWITDNLRLLDDDPDGVAPMTLLGVFEASVTDDHIDRIYGTYWWD